MNDNVIYCDTETTGLDPERHEVWDIALIEADGTEHEWHVKPRALETADPGALRLTKFYDRVKVYAWKWESADIVAAAVGRLTAGKHLVGAVPWFDATFLSKFLVANYLREAWHYHMIDVETLAIGYLRGRQRRAGRPVSDLLVPPWDSHALSDVLGIDSSTFGERHTAIADARWAKALYEKVMGG